MSAHQHSNQDPAERDYQDRDIPLGAIVRFTLYIAIFTAATFWGAKRMLFWLEKYQAAQEVPSSPFAEERVVPPQPRLLPDEKRSLEQQRAVEHEALETYGWVDKNNGVVHIPVERAMDLVLERGLPARTTK